jgi:hypothetical protein
MEIDFERMLAIFASYVKRFNAALQQQYDFEEIPIDVVGKKFPKIGKVKIGDEDVAYRYHGGGFDFEPERVDIRYNTDSGRGGNTGSIKTSPWKLLQFLQTHSETKGIEINEQEVWTALRNMELKGVVRLTPGSIGEYEIFSSSADPQ